MTIKNTKYQLKNHTREELEQLLVEMGEPGFRADQIYNWMYNHLVGDFEEMKNIPKSLREKLDRTCSILSLSDTTSSISNQTGTKKYLLKTFDNKKIESVLIPEGDRNTLCISTQVGCPLDCKFCATGLMGYTRNLTAAEIVDQYIIAAMNSGKKNITNIVYMGMGEPLLNYKATVKSLKILTDEKNKAISRHRITVSTAGIPPKIRELADSGLRVKLAFSLHSCFDDVRNKIMPINIKYPLAENVDALKYYAHKTKTRITFEYTMLKEINDRQEDISGLGKLCGNLPSKINLIPFNSIAHMQPSGISGKLAPTDKDRINWFADRLREKNITVMIRETQGDDIAAACGQLAIVNE